MIFAGIDAGSRTTKIVLVDDRRRVVASGITDQGIRQKLIAERLMRSVLRKTGCRRADIARIVATGYGRDALNFADETITEITCHARGVFEQVPRVQTVIDIGGQDSKIIRLEQGGRVRDFVMNDRCAAGTGRFLEVVVYRLGTDIGNIGRLVRRARAPAQISSTCVVFAETEIIGLLAENGRPGNILAGVLQSIASRILSMAGHTICDPVVFTGGVALIPGMARVLSRKLGHKITIAHQPQLTGALGAALLAGERSSKEQ
jgi:(R)-2-hydroxyacyl-CoA dehydratese activating ATPase